MRFRAVLLDAGQTLLHTREPVGRTYARIGAAHGGIGDEERVGRRFREAFAAPWEGRRYVGDGRLFWRRVVAHAIGTDDPAAFEALYTAFEQPEAWRVATGAREALQAWRAAGVRCALVSNWDLRLRPLLGALGLLEPFDSIAISAEVGFEKPDPRIVRAALQPLALTPRDAILVGDGRADQGAARAAGCGFVRFGRDVDDFVGLRAHLDKA